MPLVPSVSELMFYCLEVSRTAMLGQAKAPIAIWRIRQLVELW